MGGVNLHNRSAKAADLSNGKCGLICFCSRRSSVRTLFCHGFSFKKENGKSTAIYSGEKLLHSSVLILQTVVLKYALDTFLASKFMKSHDMMASIISIGTQALLTIIGSYAAYFSLYGFEALHDFLWDRFHHRRENMKNN